MVTTLNDEQFLQQFEQCQLRPVYFDHEAHIRLAWLYLAKYSLNDAIELSQQRIKRYASSIGAVDKYHATITFAMVKLIHVRRNAGEKNWLAFIKNNPDLQLDAKRVLGQFYSDDRLYSVEAKHKVIAPDLAPL